MTDIHRLYYNIAEFYRISMRITDDFSAFKNALIEDNSILLTDREGNWNPVCGLKSRLATLGCFEAARLSGIARNLIQEFDRLERVPVKRQEADSQIQIYADCLESARFVAKHLRKHLTAGKVKTLFGSLCQRIIAMQYRIEENNGGLNRQEESGRLLTQLQVAAIKWKEEYPLYQNKDLIQTEIDKLKEASRYPEFCKLVLYDSSICHLFFRCVIRDNNNVDSFVQFPSVCQRLKLALLSGRIGKFANSFDFVNWAGDEKVMSLPVQIEAEDGRLTTKNISILDENTRVRLPFAYELTVGKIIDIFARKNIDPGNLEFFQSCGITNWNTRELGRYNAHTEDYERIDLHENNKDWLFQLPALELLSLKQVKERYGIDNLTSDQFIAVAMSTRESASLDINLSHGYFSFLIFDESEQKYRVLPMGKFAKHFPSNILEKALFLTNTVESRIVYPDENSFYSHRQQASAAFVLSKEEGRELMEKVRKDLIAAHKGNMVFQFAGENCAWWPQKRLEELFDSRNKGDHPANPDLPNIFLAPVLDAQPSMQPIKAIFSFCRFLPQTIQNLVLKIAAFIFGSWRGIFIEKDGDKVYKSVSNSCFGINCEMYHPAILHKRIQSKEINGKVWFGHHMAVQS